jgi:uncharacterized protein YggU (UPF0235/DUF167 family)
MLKRMRRPMARSIIPMSNSTGIVRVKVRADARKESFVQKSTRFEISVKEPAEENRANERVRALLAQHFGVPIQKVRFEAGMRSPNKRFRIIG